CFTCRASRQGSNNRSLDLSLDDHHDLNAACLAQDVEAHMLSVTLKQKINRSPSYLQIADPHLFQKLRQKRVSEADFCFCAFHLESQRRLQKQKDSGCRPRL